MATTTIKRNSQKPGNQRNIYEIEYGYYLNFQAAGEVYRECFTNSIYGGQEQAMAAAVALRDLLEQMRDLITQAIITIKATPAVEAEVMTGLRRLVRARLREGKKAGL